MQRLARLYDLHVLSARYEIHSGMIPIRDSTMIQYRHVAEGGVLNHPDARHKGSTSFVAGRIELHNHE